MDYSINWKLSNGSSQDHSSLPNSPLEKSSIDFCSARPHLLDRRHGHPVANESLIGVCLQSMNRGNTSMDMNKTSNIIDYDRRRFVGTAAMGVAAAGAASLLPADFPAAAEG